MDDQLSSSASALSSLQIVSHVASGVRIFSVATIIYCYLRYTSLRNPANTLLYYRAIPEIVLDIGMFIGRWGLEAGPSSALCQLQGGAIEWGSNVVFLWNLYMCYSLLVVVYRVRNFARQQRINRVWIWSAYGLPALVCGAFWMICADHPVFGESNLWCWISSQYATLRMGLHIMKLVMVALFWLTIVMAVRQIWNAHQRSACDNVRVLRERTIRRYVITLTTFVAVCAVCNVPLLTRILLTPGTFQELLTHEIFSFLQGVATFVIFYYSTFAARNEKAHIWQTESVFRENPSKLDPYFRLAQGSDSRKLPAAPTSPRGMEAGAREDKDEVDDTVTIVSARNSATASEHLKALGEMVKIDGLQYGRKLTSHLQTENLIKIVAAKTRAASRSSRASSLGPGPFASRSGGSRMGRAWFGKTDSRTAFIRPQSHAGIRDYCADKSEKSGRRGFSDLTSVTGTATAVSHTEKQDMITSGEDLTSLKGSFNQAAASADDEGRVGRPIHRHRHSDSRDAATASIKNGDVGNFERVLDWPPNLIQPAPVTGVGSSIEPRGITNYGAGASPNGTSFSAPPAPSVAFPPPTVAVTAASTPIRPAHTSNWNSGEILPPIPRTPRWDIGTLLPLHMTTPGGFASSGIRSGPSTAGASPMLVSSSFITNPGPVPQGPGVVMTQVAARTPLTTVRPKQ